MTMSRTVYVASLVALATVAAASPAAARTCALSAREGAGQRRLPAVAFTRLPSGWHRYGGIGGAYATSWRYRPNSQGWALAMPRNGIVVRVFFVASRRSYPPLRLVMPAKPSTFLEGAPNTAEYRIHGRLAQCNVEVWVDIRRRHPTKSQRHHAQAVVGSIRISPSPGLFRCR
jgi:hypothetical protein